MTLDEAISYFEKSAIRKESTGFHSWADAEKQIASWLSELRDVRNTCKECPARKNKHYADCEQCKRMCLLYRNKGMKW